MLTANKLANMISHSHDLAIQFRSREVFRKGTLTFLQTGGRGWKKACEAWRFRQARTRLQRHSQKYAAEPVGKCLSWTHTEQNRHSYPAHATVWPAIARHNNWGTERVPNEDLVVELSHCTLSRCKKGILPLFLVDPLMPLTIQCWCSASVAWNSSGARYHHLPLRSLELREWWQNIPGKTLFWHNGSIESIYMIREKMERRPMHHFYASVALAIGLTKMSLSPTSTCLSSCPL